MWCIGPVLAFVVPWDHMLVNKRCVLVIVLASHVLVPAYLLGCNLLFTFLTYLLTPWSRIIFEKLSSSQLVKKFPTFCGIRRFFTAFTSAHHLSQSLVRLIQSMSPHPTSWRLLSSHLCLGLPSGLFPSGLPTKTLYSPLLSPLHATHPTHLILDLITGTVLREEYRSFSSSLCSFLHLPVTLSFLGPNILFNTLFSNTLSLHFSLNVNNQVSQPYKTTGKIIVLFILIFIF